MYHITFATGMSTTKKFIFFKFNLLLKIPRISQRPLETLITGRSRILHGGWGGGQRFMILHGGGGGTDPQGTGERKEMIL